MQYGRNSSLSKSSMSSIYAVAKIGVNIENSRYTSSGNSGSSSNSSNSKGKYLY